MARDPRITSETVVRHMTPDGRRHDSEAEAERHLAFLDAQARNERLRDVLEQGFWQDRALEERYDHESSRFAEQMVDLLNDRIDDIRALVPMMPAIEEAWAGPDAVPAPEQAALPGRQPRGRRSA